MPNTFLQHLRAKQPTIKQGTQPNPGDTTENKAPPSIPYVNPLSYLTIFQAEDGKLNLLGIGAVVLGAWIVIRLTNR